MSYVWPPVQMCNIVTVWTEECIDLAFQTTADGAMSNVCSVFFRDERSFILVGVAMITHSLARTDRIMKWVGSLQH